MNTQKGCPTSRIVRHICCHPIFRIHIGFRFELNQCLSVFICGRSFRDSFAEPMSVLRHSFCNFQSVTESTVQGAIRSEWHALYKDCNAALSTQTRSRRASPNKPTIALVRGARPLGTGAPFPARPALPQSTFRLAECYRKSGAAH